MRPLRCEESWRKGGSSGIAVALLSSVKKPSLSFFSRTAGANEEDDTGGFNVGNVKSASEGNLEGATGMLLNEGYWVGSSFKFSFEGGINNEAEALSEEM